MSYYVLLVAATTLPILLLAKSMSSDAFDESCLRYAKRGALIGSIPTGVLTPLLVLVVFRTKLVESPIAVSVGMAVVVAVVVIFHTMIGALAGVVWWLLRTTLKSPQQISRRHA